jgi:hypothetical protein
MTYSMNRLRLVRSCPDMPTWAELMQHYRESEPDRQEQLRDWLFREWALRADDDPWGALAGAVYDEIERLRKAAGGRS